MGIVLASGSPRRRELLAMLGWDDVPVIVPNCKEESDSKAPELVVAQISHLKAESVAVNRAITDIIIAADTLVYIDGTILGKPRDENDAARMLRLLSGRSHTVYTGLTVIHNGKILTEYESTLVYFRNLSHEEIVSYISSGEPMDKAGAYGAQGRGSIFINRIEGDFFNVVGLPLCRLILMLRKLEVNLT